MSMIPQERQVLADLFERIRSAATAPRDADAEAFIAEAVRAQPYAPYLLAQTALVQQQALDAAARRIQELEAAAQPAQDSGFLGSLGRSLFGGGSPAPRPGYDAGAYQRAAAAPPAAPAAPAYAPSAGPWSAPPAGSGGGFLASAMTTATGVAGGLLAVNAIESLLGGGRGGLFGGYGGGFGGGETVVNNFYDAPNPGGADAALRDAGLDSGGFQDASDYDAGQDGGGFDDGGSGGGFDV
jgi:hypothetical protein